MTAFLWSHKHIQPAHPASCSVYSFQLQHYSPLNVKVLSPEGSRTPGCFTSLLWFLKNLLFLRANDSPDAMRLLPFCTFSSHESFQASNKAVQSALIPRLPHLHSDKWMEESPNQRTSAGFGKQAERCHPRRRHRRPVNKKNKCISQLGHNCPPLPQPPWGVGRRRGSILLAAVQC